MDRPRRCRRVRPERRFRRPRRLPEPVRDLHLRLKGPCRQARPALVVAVDESCFLLWVLMITSAANRPWPGDVPIPDDCAIPGPSVIRTAKIATLKAAQAEILGVLPPDLIASVRDRLRHRLALE
ncbi:MAG: type II toxin-antitoxin system PemK/MazF family toxin [Microvirga sp.]